MLSPLPRFALICWLELQLGIPVAPSSVRLIPHPEDTYIWLRCPEREHLFTRQLSKHSIGAYMELCREIGISIEAMPRDSVANEFGVNDLEVCRIYGMSLFNQG